MLFSLLSSEPLRVRIFVQLTDRKDDPEIVKLTQRVIDSVNSFYPAQRRYVQLSALSSSAVLREWPRIKQDWGYLSTDVLIGVLLSDDGVSSNFRRYLAKTVTPASLCQYFLVTNGDNLYNIQFLPKLLPLMRRKVDLIAVDFVSRYAQLPRDRREVRVATPNQHLMTNFKRNGVDLGAMLFRAEPIARSGLRFCADHINETTIECAYDSDGYFAERLSTLDAVTTEIVREILFVHQ